MKEFLMTTKGQIAAAAVVIAVILAIVLLATSGAGASSTAGGIGLDQSIAVALADAGLKESQVTNLQGHFEEEDGQDAYDVSFTSDSYDYEYTIKAADGAILECKIESPEGRQISQDEARERNQNNGFDGMIPAMPDPGAVSSDSGHSEGTAGGSYIGADKAKAAALKDAGVNASEAVFTTAKLDLEDGLAVYEIDFYTTDQEYDYEIDALTGKVLERDSEPLDDWDDDR